MPPRLLGDVELRKDRYERTVRQRVLMVQFCIVRVAADGELAATPVGSSKAAGKKGHAEVGG